MTLAAQTQRAGVRRVRLVEEDEAPAFRRMQGFRWLLVVLGGLLLVASGVAFQQLVSQGGLEAPATTALTVQSPSLGSGASLASALLLPIAAALSFVAYAVLGLRSER